MIIGNFQKYWNIFIANNNRSADLIEHENPEFMLTLSGRTCEKCIKNIHKTANEASHHLNMCTVHELDIHIILCNLLLKCLTRDEFIISFAIDLIC